ncbi:hypothetical protein SDC9_05978 [bioreactor metagenome]|uniref:Uncharacterized protein n=1 Tax=bioreactor metagenome TaxID=1076179 RepID=A0A644T1R1_9ZZZZ|nr:recombinase family protein [Negativicutes bacterium]
MKKCVAYCRVSTDSSDQLNSLRNQTGYYLEKFQQEGFVPAKSGMLYRKDGATDILEGIFADEGISGTSTKNREAFKAMIEAAYKKEFDIIYVKNISRFGRSVEDIAKVLKDLKVAGVEVRFEDNNLSNLNGAHEVMINVLTSLAQDESRTKSDAVKFGIRRLQENGGWSTGEPFGYKIVKKYLQKYESEAEVVKLIYQLFLEGNGTGKICRYLNSKHIPTKKGVQWSQNQVVTILKNPLYTGKQITHKKETNDVNRKTFQNIDKEEWIIRPKEELRIINNETFLTVQAEREKRASMLKDGHRNSNTHLFSNILYCGKCGGNLKRKKRHTLPGRDIGYEFTCAINDMYGKSRCDCRNAVTEQVIMEKVQERIQLLREYAIDGMEDLLKIYMMVHFDYDTSPERINELEKQISKLNNRIDKNEELSFDKEIPKDECKRRNKKYRDELNIIQNELDKINNLENMKQQARLQFNEFKNELLNIDINNLTNKQLKLIFNRIIIRTFVWSKKKISKSIEYDFKFLNLPSSELDKLMEGLQSQLGKIRVPIFVDSIGDDDDDEIGIYG